MVGGLDDLRLGVCLWVGRGDGTVGGLFVE